MKTNKNIDLKHAEKELTHRLKYGTFPETLETLNALLKTYTGETLTDTETVQLPANYDGNPYGDTVPFTVGSNQTLEIVEIETLETYLPIFPGFYGTIFGNEESDEETEEIKNALENRGLPCDQAEKLTGILYDKNLIEFDYHKLHTDYLKELTETVEYALKDIEGLQGFEGLTFEKMVSPREYNFGNDSGNILVKLSDKKLFFKSLETLLNANKETFAVYIKERYTSSDGFISSYSNDAEEWITREAFEDSHKLGQILTFLLMESDFGEMELYEGTENPFIGNYIKGPCVDLLYNDDAFPAGIATLLETIDKAEELFQKYCQAMPDKTIQAKQRKGLDKNIEKIYGEISGLLEEI